MQGAAKADAPRASGALKAPFGALPASMLLVVPLLAYLAVFFFYPAINLLLFSVLTQDARGVVGRPFTWAHYAKFFDVELYMRVFWNTLRISLVTSAIAIVLAYPVAIVMVRSRPLVTRAITLIVIAPLIVSVVVRSYGWQLILANSRTGLLNWMLLSLGVTQEPVSVLYSEAAVVIGSLHVFFPMMVLPLASALGKIDPNLEDSARTLGAPGGTYIAMGVLQVILNVVEFGMSAIEAVSAPRFNATSDTLDITNRILRATERDLKARGYPVRRWPVNFHFAGVHAIRIVDGKLDGGADPGRDGMAMAI